MFTRREFGAFGLSAALLGTARAAAPVWRRPAALKLGDRVAFVALAGPADATAVRAAKAHVEKLGYAVQMADTLPGRRDRYLAGDDATRADELNAAIRDQSIRAILSVRGGFGYTRILDRIDYAALSADPKIIAGFSDVTALHLAVARLCRLVTFHAPMPLAYLAKSGAGYDYSNELFWRTLRGDQAFTLPLPAERPKPVAFKPGVARGRLVGGNLSLIAATVGTPYQIEAEGAILVLEETGEAGYRVDRMLSQLRLAGILGKFAGVILGSFDGTDDRDVTALTRDYFGGVNTPVLTGFPVGHTPFNATFAHGCLAELDATAGTVRYLEAPVTTR